MPNPTQFIVRTPEQDREFALTIAQEVAKILMASNPSKDTLYKIGDPEIRERFKGLKTPTLRSWCRKGRIGTPSTDGYRVTLEEIEHYMTHGTIKKKKK